MNLTPSEEIIMHFIWKREKALMKDILNDFPEPKPVKTTVATMLKRMTEKGFISYEQIGVKRVYYPLIKKKDYSSKRVNRLIQNFFDNSAAQLASFCTRENDLSKDELEKLRSIIDEQIKKKS
ncbi:BlaI/MecI/CopY family transcriptional regulator [Pseudotenacibaculum haliotis]|uniref:BlaI/MecI/CopY family transcriptional regulator n=1 Tax=Pseudotenacibaculum haliotis TaxID=1862138 RepID=A0ABW5LU05_9FLAO